MGIQRASLGNEAPRRSEKGRLHGFNFKRTENCFDWLGNILRLWG